ncbi:DUF4245 domain-containing protein [Micromonospora okii]|uniref:DUF4245 domain-containing protein n=1 Tax=Micromonospora okii TaxID=1182970 RepID=UPI001E40614A|nr:DUF4245 domain-containing protein [Micromonospora okii]
MEAAQPADRTPVEPTPPTPVPPTSAPAASAPTPPAAPGPEVPGPAAPGPEVPGSAQPAAPGPTASVVPPVGGKKARSERSPKDMAISLLVLLVPIALLLALYRGFLGGDQPNVVDPAPALEHARAASAFPVSQPAGLGSDWKAVSAGYRDVEGGGSALRIGYVTPEGRGAQLVQSNVPPERLLPAELTAEARPQGPTELGGRSWQRYTARGNEQALVLLEPTRTVIVVGDARENELRRLADALR